MNPADRESLDTGLRGSRTIAEWSTEQWREEATAWVDERLAEFGAVRTGDVHQPRARAWATVLRLPTDRGDVWLKATSHSTGFEVPLYPILAKAAPGQVLHPLAVDSERGWVLLPDAGASLAASLESLDLLALLERVLPQYGELQIALMPHVGEMLAIGVTDMRAERAVERFDEAATVVRDSVDEARERSYALALNHREVFASWAAELEGSSVPNSLDHNDLHAGNILVPPAEPGGGTRFYDWGDSVIAHPFASMLLGLGWVRAHWRTTADDPRLLRLRDAYLDAFTGFGSHAELVRTLELACRVGKAARCLTWARAAAMDDVAGFEQAPIELFLGIAEPSYLSDF